MEFSQWLLAGVSGYLSHGPFAAVPLGNEISFVVLCVAGFWGGVWLLRWGAWVLYLYLLAYLTPWARVTRVVRHVDGDTIRVAPLRRSREKSLAVRFIGVDTPESRRSLHQDVAPFGKEAAQYTASRLPLQQRVILRFDVEPQDRFGRALAYVYLPSGEFFNATLVQLGYGWARCYPPNQRYAAQLEQLEQRAQAQGLGLWKIYESRKVLRSDYRRSREYKHFMRQVSTRSRQTS